MTMCLRRAFTLKVRLQQGHGVRSLDCGGTYSGTGTDRPVVKGGGGGGSGSSSVPRIGSSASRSVVALIAKQRERERVKN